MNATDTVKEALREYVGDGDGADEKVLAEHNAEVIRRARRWYRGAWAVLFTVTGFNLVSVALNLMAAR